jgi:hypothetical protein
MNVEKNGGRLFRRPKLTLSCTAEGKEGRKEGRNNLYYSPDTTRLKKTKEDNVGRKSACMHVFMGNVSSAWKIY